MYIPRIVVAKGKGTEWQDANGVAFVYVKAVLTLTRWWGIALLHSEPKGRRLH